VRPTEPTILDAPTTKLLPLRGVTAWRYRTFTVIEAMAVPHSGRWGVIDSRTGEIVSRSYGFPTASMVCAMLQSESDRVTSEYPDTRPVTWAGLAGEHDPLPIT
jgi:hypothetical protein